MNPHFKYANPYQETGQWFKGNLHAHCAEHSGCSALTLKQLINRYSELKYDFLAITDHDHLTKIPKSVDCGNLLLIPGFEYSREKHMQIIGIEELVRLEQQPTIDRVLELNGLAILNHPHWNRPPHYSIDEMVRLQNFHGIEIFNGIVDRLVGRSQATDLWDELLTRGVRAWGFGSDDSHELFDIGRVWLQVQAGSSTLPEILKSLKAGNFYVSTGIVINEISLIQNKIRLETEDEMAFRFIGPKGEVLKTYLGSLAEYWIEGWEDYVRVEGWNRKGWFWTQPFRGE